MQVPKMIQEAFALITVFRMRKEKDYEDYFSCRLGEFEKMIGEERDLKCIVYL